jgi:hypothetical protein
MSQMTTHYAYAIDRRFAAVLALVGLRPRRDGVTISETTFRANLGVVHLETPLSNITGAHVTRGYRWWTAIGPRRSFVDDGLTFGTNCAAGVCVHFGEKVPTVMRKAGHSALTVTVADLEGLVATLSR